MKVLWLEIETERRWALASVGPASISAYLRRHGHQAILLRVLPDDDANKVIGRIQAESPGLLASSLALRQWPRAKELFRHIKADLDLPLIVGGIFPTFSAPDLLASPGIDYVCLGEGEVAMLELVTRLHHGIKIQPEALRNIWCQNGPRPVLRPPIANIDALPPLARDILDEIPGVIHISTQRGCPYICTHCSGRTFRDLYGHTGYFARQRTVENVIEELEHLLAHTAVRYVVFLDEVFTCHHDWLKDFFELYPKRIARPFSIQARAETVNKAMLRDLAAAGCHQIMYGIESGSWRIRQEILRRPISSQRLLQTFKWTRAAGIAPHASYLIGLPGETPADLEETFLLHEKLQPADFEYYIYHPFPGTPLFEECRTRGYLRTDPLDTPTHHRTSVLELPDLTQEDIRNAYQRMTEMRQEKILARYGPDVPDSLRALIEKQVEEMSFIG